MQLPEQIDLSKVDQRDVQMIANFTPAFLGRQSAKKQNSQKIL